MELPIERGTGCFVVAAMVEADTRCISRLEINITSEITIDITYIDMNAGLLFIYLVLLCYLEKYQDMQLKSSNINWGIARIKLGTSSTLNKNHALTKSLHYLYVY